MAANGGASPAIAAGPTALRRFIPYSILVTSAVFLFPLWIAFGLSARLGAMATVLSVVTSLGLSRLGSMLWQRHPGSRDVVFNDLMAWGFVRRLRTQRRLLRKVERLGLEASKTSDLTIEQRTALLKDLAVALETGDPYTHGHSQRVARHAYMIAKSLKLPRRVAEKIRLAGVVHDVGKLQIPREIITKPGSLTNAEFDVIKTHTTLGAEMVEMIDDPQVTDMVRHHHERLDGSGYPDKLRGDDISIGARILAVADTFDAASSLRPYRAAQKHQVALAILASEAAAGRLDAKVVDAFARYYSGRRSMRWWILGATSPRHLYEFWLLVLQRIGATSVASAAVVGATAMALGPALPRHAASDRPHPKPAVRELVDAPGAPDGSGVSAEASSFGKTTAAEAGAKADRSTNERKDTGRAKDNRRGSSGNSASENEKIKEDKGKAPGSETAPGSQGSNGGGSDKDPSTSGNSDAPGHAKDKDKDDGADADTPTTTEPEEPVEEPVEEPADPPGNGNAGGGTAPTDPGGGNDKEKDKGKSFTS